MDHDDIFDTRDPKRGGWAFIEIMGHRSHYGFVREINLLGATMCEVLVPFHDKDGVQHRHIYGGPSIFSLSPVPKTRCIEEAPRPWPTPSYPQLPGGELDEEDDDEPVDDIDDDEPDQVEGQG